MSRQINPMITSCRCSVTQRLFFVKIGFLWISKLFVKKELFQSFNQLMIIKLAPREKPGHGKEALTRDPKSVGFTDGLSNEKQLLRSILYREKPDMKYRFRTRKVSSASRTMIRRIQGLT